MRVLYISMGLPSPKGGAQLAGKRLLDKLLIHNNDEIDFYCFAKKEIPNTRTLNIPSKLNIKILGDLLYNRKLTKHIKKIINRNKLDLIHIHSYGYFAPKLPKEIPCLITFHDEGFAKSYKDNYSPWVSRILTNLTLNLSIIIRKKMISNNFHYHSISSKISSLLINKGIKKDRIYMITWGKYDINEKINKDNDKNTLSTYQIKNKDFLILMVNYISHRKGIHTVVQSVLEKNRNDIKLIIVGKPLPFSGKLYKRKILNTINEFKSKSKIIWLNYVSDKELIDLYKRADLYISASYSEGCQLTLLEAADYEIPIICSDVGATKDLFSNKVDFFKPGDSKKLLELIQKQIKEKNKKTKINYNIPTLDDIAKRIIQVYKEIA